MTAITLAQNATSNSDLLDKVYTFMTSDATLVGASEEWTSDLYVAGEEFIIHSQQAGLTQDIYIGWRLADNIGNDTYNIEIRGFGGYSAGLSWDDQPDSQPLGIYLCSYDQDLTYWIVASHRRFIVMEKVSTTYLSAYCGLYAAYATPAQYPYPLYVGASSSDYNARWSDNTNVSHAGAGIGNDDINVSAYLYDNGGWRTCRSTTTVKAGTQVGHAHVTPFSLNSHRDDIVRNIDGSYTIEDAVIINNDNPAIAGILDGYGWVTGENQSAEATITIDADTWLVMQDANQAGLEAYYAVRLV